MNTSEPVTGLDTEAIERGTAVLLQAPTFGSQADEGCVQLLRLFPSSPNVLYVTLVEPPDRRLEAWRTHAEGEPTTVGFVVVNETERATAAASTATGTGDTGVLAPVETVSTPSDLTGIGIAVHKFLDRWDGDDNPTALCFHSLTALLQHVDLRRTFQFLHVLTNQLRTGGAVAHFHVDPGAHDDRTLHTLYALFDIVVTWEPATGDGDGDGNGDAEGGTWTLQQR